MFRVKLAQLCADDGRPLYVISELCGFSHDLIGKYLRGEREPTRESVSVLTEFFCVDADFFDD